MCVCVCDVCVCVFNMFVMCLMWMCVTCVCVCTCVFHIFVVCAMCMCVCACVRVCRMLRVQIPARSLSDVRLDWCSLFRLRKEDFIPQTSVVLR